MDMLEDCMRPIVLSSAVFFACICWDMAGDKVGWRGSFWAPASVMMVPVLLWCVVFAHEHSKKVTGSDGNVDTASEVNPMQLFRNTDDDADVEMRISNFGDT
jgi:hypothetical protein